MERNNKQDLKDLDFAAGFQKLSKIYKLKGHLRELLQREGGNGKIEGFFIKRNVIVIGGDYGIQLFRDMDLIFRVYRFFRIRKRLAYNYKYNRRKWQPNYKNNLKKISYFYDIKRKFNKKFNKNFNHKNHKFNKNKKFNFNKNFIYSRNN